MLQRHLLLLASALLCSLPALATVSRDLPLPSNEPDAGDIARQVYYANHFYSFDNFSIRQRGRTVAVLINRDSDGSVSRTAVERHLNNQYQGQAIKSRDLAIFRSGKLNGTGMLVTDYTDDDKSQSYMVWLPALRKIRRFAQPEHDQAWGGSVFTFGDVTLREPQHETHELLGVKKMRTCLGVIEDLEGQPYRYVDRLPKRSCRHVGKEVYGLKSTTRFADWWYDYRISYVDKENFADYRTVYFKDGEMIKIIDRDWGLVAEANVDDPRALFWKSWYGIDLTTGRESWAVIPQSVIAYNTGKRSGFWSERTLRRIKR